MNQKKAIRNPNAQPSVLPYSSAIDAGSFVFVAGQLGVNPADNQVAEGLEAQTRQALRNVEALLREAGLDLDDVVKTTVFLANVSDFQAMNAVYREHFSEPQPARTTVGVTLPRAGCLVEIEAIAQRR